ncbi:MAG: hypothetical protein WAK17_00040 [Candidatus Nitrosopolaris sp.]|jgi:hypothetical protein
MGASVQHDSIYQVTEDTGGNMNMTVIVEEAMVLVGNREKV